MGSFRRTFGLSLVSLALLVITAFGFISSGIAATGTKAPTADPDAGLSDTERLQKHGAMRSDFEQRLNTWLAKLDVKSLDLGKLQHFEMLGLYRPAETSLDHAVATADAIIVGSVTDIASDGLGSVAQVTVDRSLKGNLPQGIIRVAQSSGFRPTSDWNGTFIADNASDPLLLPGHRVLLLLQNPDQPNGGFRVQPGSGQYNIAAGAVSALEVNPFAQTVNGQTEAAFVQQVIRATNGTP